MSLSFVIVLVVVVVVLVVHYMQYLYKHQQISDELCMLGDCRYTDNKIFVVNIFNQILTMKYSSRLSGMDYFRNTISVEGSHQRIPRFPEISARINNIGTLTIPKSLCQISCCRFPDRSLPGRLLTFSLAEASCLYPIFPL